MMVPGSRHGDLGGISGRGASAECREIVLGVLGSAFATCLTHRFSTPERSVPAVPRQGLVLSPKRRYCSSLRASASTRRFVRRQ